MPDDGGSAAQRVGDTDVVREVYDQLPVVSVAFEGPEHRIVAANAAFRRTTGQDRLIGLPLREALPEVVHELYDRVYETGVPQTARGWRTHVDLDGTGEPTELFFDVTAVPRHAPDGRVVGTTVAAIDVTERVRGGHEHTGEDVVTSLQRRLLSPGLPVLPSVRLAGSYLLADADGDAGGDWFDAIPLHDGRVALVVGDVVGHGMAASATMGQLRAVVQDRLDETGDILVALAAADRLATRVPGAHAATVCVAVLDPADGALAHCSAGHPPPLVIGADETRYLPMSGAGPLGTHASYAVAHDRLGVGEVLLLYTDGLIERPGREPAAATVELAQVAADIVAGRALRDAGMTAVEPACTQTLEMLVRATGHTDDITLLAAQRTTPVEDLLLCLDAEPGAAAAARAGLTRWLHDHDVAENDRTALRHAVTELVTNAVEHSSPDTGGGTVALTASLDVDGVARVSVADDGRWRVRPWPTSAEFRRDHGLGLAMTSGFVDRLDIDAGEHGTTATVWHRLTHPARLLTADQLTHGRSPTTRTSAEPSGLTVIHAPTGRLAVHGPLDATTTDRLAGELDRLTLGHTHPLVVDLTAVTHLASAAVAVLHRATARQEPALRLYAPAGSTAHHVLTLVGLPHTTTDPHGTA